METIGTSTPSPGPTKITPERDGVAVPLADMLLLSDCVDEDVGVVVSVGEGVLVRLEVKDTLALELPVSLAELVLEAVPVRVGVPDTLGVGVCDALDVGVREYVGVGVNEEEELEVGVLESDPV